jgi:hypothetical protein
MIDEDRTFRAPTALPEDDEVDDDLSSYCYDNLRRSSGECAPQSSGVMAADPAHSGPLLGVGAAARGGGSAQCTLFRDSTYASSLNQTTIR